MKPTYRVLRERRGDGATLDTVADDLRCALPLATSARCMNPECSEICEWSPRRGRPPLFHDRLCHERYHLVRRRLVEEREDIFEALARKPGPSTVEMQRRPRDSVRSTLHTSCLRAAACRIDKSLANQVDLRRLTCLAATSRSSRQSESPGPDEGSGVMDP